MADNAVLERVSDSQLSKALVRYDKAPTDVSAPFCDLVESYVDPKEALATPPWLTTLKLERLRRNVRCLGSRTRILKRATDVVVAAAMLVLLAPVMAIIALLVKLTSRGPAVFSQLRAGVNLRAPEEGFSPDEEDCPCAAGGEYSGPDRRQNFCYGKPFVLYKFRTMTVDAERNGAQFAQKNDPRVTPLGRILRRTRLDETPQLWNVLKGEMSLVGPRPERPEFIAGLSAQIPDYLDRLGLKPGLTGVAQIVNGYDNELEGFRRKVFFDLLYLQNCCFTNDLKILWRTIGIVLTGRGAM